MSEAKAKSLLSDHEVTELLGTLKKPAGGAATPVKNNAAPPPPPMGKISAYDFKRPERVGKDQMRALKLIHEGFSRNFGAALSALLRSVVEVKLNGVDQLTYSEFIVGLPNPTCFNLLRAEPLEGQLILAMPPAVLFPIIDRLLGGGKEMGPTTKRDLTDIELRLTSRITKLFLVEMKRAWESIVSLNLSVERVENNPHLVQIVPPNEVVIAVGFEIVLGDVREMMHLCIPFNSIERISGRLQDNSWFTYGKAESTPETTGVLRRQLDHTALELTVTLAHTKISTSDLLGLRVGDIIATEHDVDHPMEVSVEGALKYTARPGSFKGRKAICVEECLEDE